MAKKIDPQKKLLITAIKKTINKNSVLPILEDVLLTGTEAIVSDLETSVVIPYPTGVNVCVPSNRFIDLLDMMESPHLEEEYADQKEPHFHIDGKTYLGSKEQTKSAWEEAVAEQNCTLSFYEYVAQYCADREVKEGYEFKTETVKTFGVIFSEGKRRVKVLGDNPDHFPKQHSHKINETEWEVIGFLTDSDMEKLENSLPFISNDDLRPAMTGVYLGEQVVTTDAHRMYFNKLSDQVTVPFILPKKTANILLALGGEWKIAYIYNEGFTNVCFIRKDGVKVFSRPIDARFPDYKVVIPEGVGNTVVTINPDELLQELKNAGKFANKSTNMVVLGVNGKMKISSQDIDFAFEYANEFEQAEIQHNEGEGFDIGFNAKFLNEIVNKEKDNPIVMKLWAPTKAAIINEHYLVMPLMINEGN